MYLIPILIQILIQISTIVAKEFMPSLIFDMQVIAIAIGRYQEVKMGIKCNERANEFMLGLVSNA